MPKFGNIDNANRRDYTTACDYVRRTARDKETLEASVLNRGTPLPALVQEVTVSPDGTFFVINLNADNQITATIVEVTAVDQFEGDFFKISFVHGLTIVGADFETFKIIFQDDVLPYRQ